jgi:hypothetical protein
MKRYAITILATLTALTALTACGSNNTADAGACKKALEKQMDAALSTGAKGTQPPSCVGLDQKTLSRISGEVIDTAWKKQMDKANLFATPAS